MRSAAPIAAAAFLAGAAAVAVPNRMGFAQVVLVLLAAGGADKTVDVHLSWLRRKLGETAAEPRMLHSVRGVGVKLVPAP